MYNAPKRRISMEPGYSIRVTGRGTLRLTPDTTCVTITLRGLAEEYNKALKDSAQDTETLRDLLEGLGFQRAELKTLSFDVNTKYENHQDDHGEYHQQLTGYEFTHSLQLRFPLDNVLLGRILYTLANSSVSPELRLSYTVRNPETAKNRLLTEAVKDAKTKAKVLSAAAGAHLLELRSIDYSQVPLDLEVRPMRRAVMAMAAANTEGCYNLDIQPDDIEVSDTVTMVWEMA